jgi:hypothetical protein
MAATRNRSGSEGAEGVIDRITVALIPKAANELQKLQDRTGLSKTDLVNRAITLYEFIDGQQSAGHELLVRDRDSGETRVILLL